MEAAEFVAEYERRFNEGSPTGDFSRVAELRTPDATVSMRAPGSPDVSGRVASVGESLPEGATLHFEDVEELPDGRIRARLSGEGYPPGAVTGTAWFTLDGDLLSALEIELDEPLT